MQGAKRVICRKESRGEGARDGEIVRGTKLSLSRLRHLRQDTHVRYESETKGTEHGVQRKEEERRNEGPDRVEEARQTFSQPSASLLFAFFFRTFHYAVLMSQLVKVVINHVKRVSRARAPRSTGVGGSWRASTEPNARAFSASHREMSSEG